MICHLVCVYLGSIQDGFTPLSVAAQNGHWRVVRLLIAAKVDVKATPVAKEMISANGINPTKVAASGSNGKITKGDIEAYLTSGVDASSSAGWGGTRDEEKKKMSMMRRNIDKRLVAVKNETAMLTTFNELDMKPIMDLRKKYKEKFKESHGVNLGFMSFFTKAVTEALKLYPAVNAMIDGDYMITHDFADIGIAVSSPKGLLVPIVRNAEQMSLAEIEAEINPVKDLSISANYTFTELKDGTRIRLPKHRANASLGYDFSSKTFASLDYQYVGKRQDTDFATFTNVALEAYSLINLYFSHKLLENNKLKFFASINNLFKYVPGYRI